MRSLTALDSPEDWCEHLLALDEQYGTTSVSPLHHDNRCPVHVTESDEDYARRQGLERIRIRSLNNEVRANSDR